MCSQNPSKTFVHTLEYIGIFLGPVNSFENNLFHKKTHRYLFLVQFVIVHIIREENKRILFLKAINNFDLPKCFYPYLMFMTCMLMYLIQ